MTRTGVSYSHLSALPALLPGLREAGSRFQALPPCSVQLTCAGHSSEDPALAVLDTLTARGLPAPQDVHTADPEHGADAILVIVVPASQQHTLVIVAVDLQPEGHQRDRAWGAGAVNSVCGERQGKEFRRGNSPCKDSKVRQAGIWEKVGAGAQGVGERRGRREEVASRS